MDGWLYKSPTKSMKLVRYNLLVLLYLKRYAAGSRANTHLLTWFVFLK